jgi:DNA-binding IclR family transcriptional regulator
MARTTANKAPTDSPAKKTIVNNLAKAFPPAAKPPKYRVPAVRRAFAILETLSVSEGGLQAKEVATSHQMPYSTAFYLLETMAEAGYLRRVEEDKRYVLGHRLFRLANRASTVPYPDFRHLAGQALEELVEVTGITGHIAVLEGDEVIYVDKRDAPGLVRLNTWIGRRNNAYCTSVGKALLMYLPESDIKAMYPPAKLVRKTDRTITTIEGLLADLALSRERGFAYDDGEDGPESRCVAAPIFDHNGTAIASIGLVGVFSQIEPQRADSFGKLVRKYATDVSRKLGYSGKADSIGGTENRNSAKR